MEELLGFLSDATERGGLIVPPGAFYEVPDGVDPKRARRQLQFDMDDVGMGDMYDRLACIVEGVIGLGCRVKRSSEVDISTPRGAFLVYGVFNGDIDDVGDHYDALGTLRESSDNLTAVATLKGKGYVVYPKHKDLSLFCTRGTLLLHLNDKYSLHHTENNADEDRIVVGCQYILDTPPQVATPK